MTSGYKAGGISANTFDVDADGIFLYIAALDASNLPVVLRMMSDLSADAILSYNPGAGTESNLMAGNLSGYWVWAAGDFGSATKVLRTTDRGNSWYVMNDWSNSRASHPIFVGPGDDTLVSVGDGLTFQQTRVEGDDVYWIDRATLDFELRAIDRLGDNFDHVFIGAYWYTGATLLVEHTPNSGLQWGDLTLALPGATITSIVAGNYAS